MRRSSNACFNSVAFYTLFLSFQTRKWWQRCMRRLSNACFNSAAFLSPESDWCSSSDGPSSHMPSLGKRTPRCRRGGIFSLIISPSIMLCSTAQVRNMLPQDLTFLYLNPLSSDAHHPFRMPNTHSTSFRTLSIFDEK